MPQTKAPPGSGAKLVQSLWGRPPVLAKVNSGKPTDPTPSRTVGCTHAGGRRRTKKPRRSGAKFLAGFAPVASRQTHRHLPQSVAQRSATEKTPPKQG